MRDLEDEFESVPVPAITFVVTDENGNLSYDDVVKEPESFADLKSARRCAMALAEEAPGHEIKIFKLIELVIIPLAPLEIRKVDLSDRTIP